MLRPNGLEPLARSSSDGTARRGPTLAPQEGEGRSHPKPASNWKEELLKHSSLSSQRHLNAYVSAFCARANFIKTQVWAGRATAESTGWARTGHHLVSFQVYFQAKRWRNSAWDRREVRDFRGAMSEERRAYFHHKLQPSPRTRLPRPAETEHHPLTLVDGSALCDLLLEYEIGVKGASAPGHRCGDRSSSNSRSVARTRSYEIRLS